MGNFCVICGEPEPIGQPHAPATCALNLRSSLAAAEKERDEWKAQAETDAAWARKSIEERDLTALLAPQKGVPE